MSKDLANVEHVVYRCFDQQNRLIYVGCTARYKQRINKHYKTMWWAEQIARIETEAHPTRTAGLAAEKWIRDTEHPRWNIEARWMHRQHWNNQMFNDFITALEKHPMNRGSAFYTARITAARQLQAIRYGTNQQQAA